MNVTQDCALGVLVVIASHPGELFTADELAERVFVNPSTLKGRIMPKMVAGGLVEAPWRGYRLARPATEIKVGEVLTLMRKDVSRSKSPAGAAVARKAFEAIAGMSIADLAAETETTKQEEK